ncbi:hypothetical protein GCM10027299_30220 [Larkinella ripae]
MKTITITNWIFIGLYLLLILYTLLGVNRPGNDAAGRGMETGFVVVGGFAVAALLVLNVLPYRATKIIALVLMALPGLMILYNVISNYLVARQYDQTEEARMNGTLFFDDAPRRELAAAIAAADTARLRTLLQKPLSNLNESGHQGTTLLDFAAQHAIHSSAPEKSMRCLDILLEKGATIQNADSTHKPTHYQICRTGSAALLEWFLKKGADPNAKPYDSSPLIFEVMGYGEERLEKVTLLLDYGADPDTPATNTGYAIRDWYTPLMHAAQEQLWDVCHLLLEKGADPTYRTPQGEDLKKIMTRREELYADMNDTPATYTDFKKALEADSTKKP